MCSLKIEKLKNLCTKIGSGATPKGGKESYKNHGISLIRSQNILMNEFSLDGLAYIDDRQASELRNVIVQTDDVLLNITGDSVARVCQAPAWILPARVNQHVAIIRPDPTTLNPTYLRYFLASPKMQDFMLGLASSGATRQALTKAMIEDFEIPLPSMHIQNRIADTLNQLDQKIEVNKKINETLESMAKAIFKEWFIDFGPVRAKAEGKKPFGMDDETAALFPDSFEESELGQIPKGWSSGKLDEIAEVVGGGTPSTSESSYYCQPSTGISWLSPKDLSGYSWKYISHGATDITESGLKNSSARMLPQGAVLFSSRAPIGYVAIAEKELSTNQGFKSLVPKNGANTEFLYYLAKANVELIESRASGSTFKEISGNGMKELPVVLPSKQILEAFQNIVSEFSKLQRELRHETDILIKTRDLLLPKLISGEIELKELE